MHCLCKPTQLSLILGGGRNGFALIPFIQF